MRFVFVWLDWNNILCEREVKAAMEGTINSTIA